MKKIIFLVLMLVTGAGIFAQDIKKARSYYESKQLDKAKTEVDALVSKNPNDPLALYLQSKVYVAIASNKQFQSLVQGDARAIAFEAFKKALANDKGNLVMLELNKDKFQPIFDIYTGYYDTGAEMFNEAAGKNDKQVFEQSFNMFKNADMVGHYIYTNKWALSDIDTGLVLTIAKAAINAGKKDEALTYLKRLADAGIYQTKDDKTGYALVYQWLTYHFKDAKDEANFLKYSSLGKKYFPKDDYYDAVALDYYRDNKNYDALFKKYAEVTAAFPDSLQYHFNYANEAFNYVYNSDEGVKVTNKEALLKAIGGELEKALSLKPADVNTNWLLGQYYYNQGVDLREAASAIKGTKPEDVKKKADLTAQAKDVFAKAVPYAEKALTTLESSGYKKSDKSRYKSITDLLQRIYQGLNQSDKVKIYQQKYDAADTKFVNT